MLVVEKLAQIAMLRRIVLPIIKSLNFDFSLKHPWVPGVSVRMNSFIHKGYWFFGKSREIQTMELFRQLIELDDHVVEVGGHIGFISTYFSYCVGGNGLVTVFEPGSNNAPYIKVNIAQPGLEKMGRIVLIEAAVGQQNGQVVFYEDEISGQNNSIVPDFRGLYENSKLAFVKSDVQERIVDLVSLGEELGEVPIAFVKIDVEGYELSVLNGMKKILSTQQPIIMVEVQADHLAIHSLLKLNNYRVFSQARREIVNPLTMKENNFALHLEKHSVQIQKFFDTGL